MRNVFEGPLGASSEMQYCSLSLGSLAEADVMASPQLSLDRYTTAFSFKITRQILQKLHCWLH